MDRFFLADKALQKVGRTEPLPKYREPHPDQGKKRREPPIQEQKADPRVKRPKSLVSGASFEAEKYVDKDKHVIALNTSDWIFTQVVALSSCPILGFYIPCEYKRFVNDNGNAWSNENLAKYYGSFIGGHNYYEHEQEPMRSYGFIVDAKLRPVGEVYYVDLLVATSTVKPPSREVLNRIASNKIVTLSMGCESSACRCSRCGKEYYDVANDILCSHLNYQMNNEFVGTDGGAYTTAMIVTDGVGEDGKGYIEFGEISWVENPAFAGATSNFRIDLPQKQQVFFEMPKAAVERGVARFAGAKYWIDKGLVEVRR